MSSSNHPELNAALTGLPLGAARYFSRIGSTNDEALAWAAAGAPDFSLVVADEQTSGRGRMNRKWFTPPGAALAFSLVLRPSRAERPWLSRFSGLAALALLQVLQAQGLQAHIKWPNDVLLNGKKTAGILLESVWLGDEVDSLVLGMGVNITPQALPPAEELNFPATSLQTEGFPPLSRWQTLRQILEALLHLRPSLTSPAFLQAWQQNLAYQGETVLLWSEHNAPVSGTLLGLSENGSLRLRRQNGSEETFSAGEIHLRPL